MAKAGGSKLGPVKIESGPSVSIPPVIKQSPFINLPVPSPSALRAAHNEQVSNTISMTGARVGDPEPYVFGRTLARGRVISADDSTGDLVIDVLWSVGEIQEYENRVFANVAHNLGNTATNEHFTGTAGQSASAVMTALKGSYDTLAGKAHSVLTLKSVFQPKTLDIKTLMKGLKLFDPRTSPQTTAYSTNPALALARILVDSGYTVDWTSVGETADYCDELVGSPGIKRWEISGQIWNRQQLQIWVKALADYAHCFIDLQGNTVFLVPDKPRTSSPLNNHVLVGNDDFLSATARRHRSGSNNVPEAVIVDFETLFVSSPLVEGNDTIAIIPDQFTYGTPSGAGTVSRLEMPFVPDVARAGRHAEEAWRKAQNNLELHFDSFDKGINRSVGDLALVTDPALALSSEYMYLLDNRQIAPGRWRVVYHQYNATNYSDVLYTQNTYYVALQDPNLPPTGPTPTLTEELFAGTDGVTYARIKITFVGVSWAYIKEYRVTITGSDGLYSEAIDPRAHNGSGVTHINYTTEPLTTGVTYTVNVYVRSVTNVLGSPGTAQLTSAQGTNALLNPDMTLTINMHRYILDGDAEYVTSSTKTGSPAFGETWSSRFGAESPQGQAWAAGETWLGNQTRVTLFVSEAWDSGTQWDGLWKFSVLNFTGLASAAMAHSVLLSADVSPLSFSDNAGSQFSGLGRSMKAQSQVADSPITAGQGLHIKLPVPVSFELGA